jgi:hypothetical protein
MSPVTLAGAVPPAAAAPAADQSRAARLAGLVLAAPLGRRARAEVAYCLLAVPVAAVCFAPLMAILVPGLALTASLIGSFAGLVLLSVAGRASRRIGGLHRWLAGRLLGARVLPPAPFQPGKGVLGRIDTRLRDPAGCTTSATRSGG